MNIKTLRDIANIIIFYGTENDHYIEPNEDEDQININDVINWLDWLKEQNIYPAQEYIDCIMKDGNLIIINYLKENIL